MNMGLTGRLLTIVNTSDGCMAAPYIILSLSMPRVFHNTEEKNNSIEITKYTLDKRMCP